MGGRSGQTLTRSGQQVAVSGNSYPDANIIESGQNTSGYSVQKIASLAGIPKDFKGNLLIDHKRDGTIDVRISNEGLSMQRIINKDKGVVKNEYFEILDNSRYKGRGYKIFESQVNEMRKSNFKKIQVYAAGDIRNPRYNGYYTWARFGYQPDNAARWVERVNTNNGTQFKSWYEMMNTETGQRLWKQVGSGWSGEFDLKNGSLSMKTWNNYLKYRKLQS